MPNYIITRIEKYKGGSGSPVTKIEKHNERMKKMYKSNPDIDSSKSHLNYNLIKPSLSYKEEINKRLAAFPGIKLRKDSVLFQDAIVTASPEFLNTLDAESLKTFFKRALDFYTDKFGYENFISAVVHMDEKTPHMHFCFVPITADGRLSSKELIGGPSGLRKLQDEFYIHMTTMFPDLDRGLPTKDTHRTHLSVSMYKEVAEIDNAVRNISDTVKSIGHLDMKSGKEDVVKQLSELTPQIAKMQNSLNSNIEYVEKIQQREDEYKAEIKQLTEEVRTLSRRVLDLESVKDNLYRRLNEALDLIETFKYFVLSVPKEIAQKIIYDRDTWKVFRPISHLVESPTKSRDREAR